MRPIDADKLRPIELGIKLVVPYGDIKDAPTIDAVEVVRCEDCRWYCVDEHQCKHQICMLVFDDDFCSYGERKEV